MTSEIIKTHASEQTAHAAMVAGVNLLIGGVKILHQAIGSAPQTPFKFHMQVLAVEVGSEIASSIDAVREMAETLGMHMEDI